MGSITKTNNRIWIGLFIIAFSILAIFPAVAYASSTYFVTGKSYETPNEKGFDLTGVGSSSFLSFGKKSIGSLAIDVDFVEKTTVNGFEAYGASGDILLSYSYDGLYQNDNKDAWNLCDSDEKNINGVAINKKIDLGAVVVQKSSDGKNWETVSSTSNIFNLKKDDNKNFYTITESDLKDGAYYRVYVAYRMKKRTGTSKTAWVITTDEFEYKNYVEAYSFFAGYDKNAVRLFSLSDGSDITGQPSVEKGFVVDKQGTKCKVTLSKDGGYQKEINDLASVNEPGKYEITVTSLLGKEFKYVISIVNGMEITCLNPSVYEGDKDWDYSLDVNGEDSASYGLKSLSTLKIAQQANSRISTTKRGKYDAYGITGKSVSLFLHLEDREKLQRNGWDVYSDVWGKKEKQTIDGIWTGSVGTGALIIQKSKNGQDWDTLESDVYANGIYTTDFYNYYGNRGDVLIYTPDGEELLAGMYIRVLYAYELYNEGQKLYDRCVEEYELYLCSNELNAITFHNLSLTDKIEDVVGADKDTDLTMYKKAETLVSGSGTATGFMVDTSLNPTASYSIKKNGVAISRTNNNEYTEDGKYEITLKSAVGDEEKVVIYVDKHASEDALKTYFGESFIQGKRIYSEGKYPVYEGGVSSYSLVKIDDTYLPISGEIVNTTTGEVITLGSSRAARTGKITSPGAYTAIFTTAQTTGNSTLAGDYRVFTFNFEIIAEGTAPGPKINQESLAKFAISDISDSYPMYYGLTYSSASKGNITLAFATEEAAREYAYNYEKGMVEKQDDGTYRYTGSFVVSQKESFDSAWDLTDAMNYFADQAVQRAYFDLSDQYTFITLEDSVINNTPNLRTKELNRSVTIFATDEQKLLLCKRENELPIISAKPYAYLTPGNNGDVKAGYHDFEFIHDKYGCDSNKIVIIDCNGKKYNIEYNKGVSEQLNKYKCPSGVVTINESTVYDDIATYNAIFIADGDNTAKVSIKYYVDGTEKAETIDKDADGAIIKADAFSIQNVIDELDPYTIVTISNSKDKYYYVADQTSSEAWAEQGEYTITVTNRLGAEYSFVISIDNSTYAAISFAGSGTENVSTIVTSYGEKDIKLPELNRVGFDFEGYTDDEGASYKESIGDIKFKGNKVLTAVWKAKEISIILKDINGNEINRLKTTYGTPVVLENPKLEEGYSFEGWMRDGNIILGNTLVADSENDIELFAVVSGGDGSGIVIDEKKSPIGFIFVMLGVILCGATVYTYKKRKPVENTEIIDKEDENE